MSFKIGIGALITDDIFNDLRQLELLAADKSGNTYGLHQEPHVTVKVPFTVPDSETYQKVVRIVDETSKNLPPFSIELNGLGNFGTEVIYAKVVDSPFLNDLHEDLLKRLEPLGVEPHKHEGSDIVFHSTLAMKLSKKEYELATNALSGFDSLKFTTNINSLGIFKPLENERLWVVTHTSPLKK